MSRAQSATVRSDNALRNISGQFTNQGSMAAERISAQPRQSLPGEDQPTHLRPQTARAMATGTGGPDRQLHDKETFLKKKQADSAVFFTNNRVQTASHIVRKGGKAVAMAFPLEKTGWKAPNSYQNTKRSSEIKSWSRETFKLQQYQHIGMNRKPLTKYDPNSYRNRLPQPQVVMPYKNSSQIVIGDRASYKPTHFKAINRMYQAAPDLGEATTNPGILARRTLWTHRHQELK